MKPRLVVAYDDFSASPMQIVNAVGDDCDLIFATDINALEDANTARILPRVGTVADVGNLDIDAIVRALRPFGPSGVVAFTDSQLDRAASLAGRLNLPGNDPRITTALLDKFEQRTALRRGGVLVPGFTIIEHGASPRNIRDATSAIAFPCVLKPRNGYSSRDTSFVNDVEDLIEAIVETASRDASHEQDYIVEEYLADTVPIDQQVFGDYVSVESVVSEGSIRHLVVTGKFPLEAPYRETGNFIVSALSARQHDEVTSLASLGAVAIGVRSGCLHTEIKLTPSGPRIIEVNGRVAGGGIDELFVECFGESLIRIAALTALGKSVPEDIVQQRPGVAYQFFVQAPMHARRVEHIGGLDRLSAVEGVVQVSVNKEPGDDVDWRRGSQDYVLSVRGSARDHEHLRQIHALALSQLDVQYG